MKNGGVLRWYLFLGALLFTSLIVFVTTPNAFGCSTNTDNRLGQCILAQNTSTTDPSTPTATSTATPTATLTLTTTLADTLLQSSTTTSTLVAAQLVTPTLTVTPTATPKPTLTPVPTPRGDSPETARDPFYVRPQNCINAMCPEQVGAPSLTSTTDWTWIGANSSIWYKMDDGHGFQLQIWLFANGQQGLGFDVFAPEQKDMYNSKPIGRGSFNKSQANIGTDLFYSGRTQAPGVWHLRVYNTTSAPIAFALKFTRTIPTMSNVCDECHKLIGTDWGSCVDGPNSNFCQQLHDYYDTNPDCYNHDLTNGC